MLYIVYNWQKILIIEKMRILSIDFQIQYISKNRPTYWLKVILQIRSYSVIFGEQKKYFSCSSIDPSLFSSAIYYWINQFWLIFFKKDIAKEIIKRSSIHIIYRKRNFQQGYSVRILTSSNHIIGKTISGNEATCLMSRTWLTARFIWILALALNAVPIIGRTSR